MTGCSGSRPIDLSFQGPSIAHIGAVEALGSNGGSLAVSGSGFGGGHGDWTLEVLVWQRTGQESTAQMGCADDRAVEAAGALSVPISRGEIGHERWVFPRIFAGHSRAPQPKDLAARLTVLAGPGMGAMWLTVRVADVCSTPFAWQYDAPRVESVAEDGPRILARRLGNGTQVEAYLDAAAGGSAEGYVVVRGADFGLDPTTHERNTIKILVDAVECQGAEWRSVTELRCQMQPLAVGPAQIHVAAARSRAAPFPVFADCAPGAFRRHKRAERQLWCEPCPQGTECPGLARRPVARHGTFGYRLSGDHSTHVLFAPCDPVEACAGGALGVAGAAGSRRCEGMEVHQQQSVAECTSCTAPCVPSAPRLSAPCAPILAPPDLPPAQVRRISLRLLRLGLLPAHGPVRALPGQSDLARPWSGAVPGVLSRRGLLAGAEATGRPGRRHHDHEHWFDVPPDHCQHSLRVHHRLAPRSGVRAGSRGGGDARHAAPGTGVCREHRVP